MDVFNPRALVTRAELSAVLSRFMYGRKYDIDSSNNWFKPHMDALNRAGYMRKLDDPMKIEQRGFLFIILQRMHENK
jgi:hypothetical protein